MRESTSKQERAREAVEKAAQELGTLDLSDGLSKPDVLEVLGRLHALEVERFYERRRLEWRLAFTLWLAVVAVGALVIDNIPSDAPALVVGIAFGSIFAVISALHLIFEWRAVAPGAEQGRSIGYAMDDLQRAEIGLKPTGPIYTYRAFWSHYWLPLVTLLLGSAITFAAILKVR